MKPVLDAVDDENEALLVHVAHVPGAEEAPDEAGVRLLLLVPIARHHLRPGDAELADLSSRHLGLGVFQRADAEFGAR